MILLFNTIRLLSLTHWSRVVSDKRNATSNSLIGRRVVIHRLTSLCFRVSFSSLLFFNLPRILGVHSSSFAHLTQSYYLLNGFIMRLHSHYHNQLQRRISPSATSRWPANVGEVGPALLNFVFLLIVLHCATFMPIRAANRSSITQSI